MKICYDAFARQTPSGRFAGAGGEAKAACTMRVATCSFVRLPGAEAGDTTPALRFDLYMIQPLVELYGGCMVVLQVS